MMDLFLWVVVVVNHVLPPIVCLVMIGALIYQLIRDKINGHD